MQRILSVETSRNVNQNNSEFVTKRLCCSFLLTVAFFAVLGGFLLGKFVADRSLEQMRLELNDLSRKIGILNVNLQRTFHTGLNVTLSNDFPFIKCNFLMIGNNETVYVPIPNAFLQKIKYSEMHDTLLAEKLNLVAHLRENDLVLPIMGSNTVVYRIMEYDPLLDSSNMTLKDWIRIVKDIEKYYDCFDGFVVLHGTDTMAYTSSALSFMLENLQKPVIITGSQIPIFETRSDAKDNFLSSLIFAGCYDIPEVCVFFANKLLRGNRTTKISSNLLNAFDSPNYHSLAIAGIEVHMHQHYIRKRNPTAKLLVHTELNSNVGTLSFFPTITSLQLESFLKPPIEGVVLQTYGAGNIPSNRADILRVIKNAVEKGVLILNVTQCSKGTVSIAYECGKALEATGIISGNDMTVEAALTKLIFILGQPGDYESRVKLLKSDLRGELTHSI